MSDELPAFLIAALLLILISASSLFGPLCLLLSFSLLGACAASVLPVFSLFNTGRGFANVLYLIPLFIALFCAAYPGLRASVVLASTVANAPKRIISCVKITAFQIGILSAGSAAAFLIYHTMN